MKVLIINTYDMLGGAARAAYRLHRSLLAEGIDSQMLVQNKSSDDFTVLAPGSLIARGMNKLRPTLASLPVLRYKNRNKSLFSPASLGFSGMVKRINALEPDIVHLHWVCGGMMRIEDIAKINAPIVWTLHDDWVFTGGCHIKRDCRGYISACGACPALGSEKAQDLSRSVFLRKQKAFSKKQSLSFVCVSQWLAQCASESALFSNKQVVYLPNPLNTARFKPLDKKNVRILWNLPHDKKLVLFGASSAISDSNKGFKELTKSLANIKDQSIELVVFGSSRPRVSHEFGRKVHYLGYLHDEASLVTLYNAVDVMVVPSLQEAFCQTASEALACATPVVAFATSGLLSIVDHKSNGYLAKPFDPLDLAKGINWVLQTAKYDVLCSEARKKILREFDSQLVAMKYIDLYQNVINE